MSYCESWTYFEDKPACHPSEACWSTRERRSQFLKELLCVMLTFCMWCSPVTEVDMETVMMCLCFLGWVGRWVSFFWKVGCQYICSLECNNSKEWYPFEQVWFVTTTHSRQRVFGCTANKLYFCFPNLDRLFHQQQTRLLFPSFPPLILGEMIQFDQRMYFNWVVQPPFMTSQSIPPRKYPPRNKALIRPFKGSQLFISPDHKALCLGVVREGGRLTSHPQQFLSQPLERHLLSRQLKILLLKSCVVRSKGMMILLHLSWKVILLRTPMLLLLLLLLLSLSLSLSSFFFAPFRVSRLVNLLLIPGGSWQFLVTPYIFSGWLSDPSKG